MKKKIELIIDGKTVIITSPEFDSSDPKAVDAVIEILANGARLSIQRSFGLPDEFNCAIVEDGSVQCVANPATAEGGD